MKLTHILASTLLLAANAFAGEPVLQPAGVPGGIMPEPVYQQPNAVTCLIDNSGSSITYISGDMMGNPSLTLNIANAIKPNVLASVNVENTLAGQMVSGIDAGLMDATLSYTLIVPNILLDEQLTPVSFDTMLIESFSGASPWGPVQPGVQDSNTYTKVSCVAKLLLF